MSQVLSGPFAASHPLSFPILCVIKTPKNLLKLINKQMNKQGQRKKVKTKSGTKKQLKTASCLQRCPVKVVTEVCF